MESVQVLSPRAFISDVDLTKELIAMEYGPNKEDVGVPLCLSKLSVGETTALQ